MYLNSFKTFITQRRQVHTNRVRTTGEYCRGKLNNHFWSNPKLEFFISTSCIRRRRETVVDSACKNIRHALQLINVTRDSQCTTIVDYSSCARAARDRLETLRAPLSDDTDAAFSLQVADQHTSPEWQFSIRAWILGLALPLLPFGCIRSLRLLVPFSAIATTSVLIGLGCTIIWVIDGVSPFSAEDAIPLPDVSSRPWIAPAAHMPLFFTTVLFAMEGIGTVSVFCGRNVTRLCRTSNTTG